MSLARCGRRRTAPSATDAAPARRPRPSPGRDSPGHSRDWKKRRCRRRSVRPRRVEIDLLCDQRGFAFILRQFISVRRRKFPNSIDPILGGASPALGSRHEFMALSQRSDSQPEVSCFPVLRPRIDRCSASLAKGQHAPVATFGDFHECFGFSSQEAKRTGNKNRRSEGGPGQHLAIGAMAYVGSTSASYSRLPQGHLPSTRIVILPREGFLAAANSLSRRIAMPQAATTAAIDASPVWAHAISAPGANMPFT